MAILLRRRRLGRTSCREVCNFSKEGLVTVRSDKLMPKGHNILFRWGTTSKVSPGFVVVNSTKAIHNVTDKVGFRLLMAEHNLCPITVQHADQIQWGISPVWVVRPAYHAQGRNLHVVRSDDELRRAVYHCGVGWYASPLIKKVAEYRVFVVQGRVTCVAQKIPDNPNKVAWNVNQGSKFVNVRWANWPLRAIRYAVEAFNLSKLDFGGVDVMVDEAGDPYVLEINSAPSLTSPYRQECMAKAFDYIIREGKGHIPLIKELGGYRKFIHPAINNRAKLV